MSVLPTSRIHIVFGVFFLIALVLIARLFFLQVIHGESYTARAEDQYITPTTNEFDRGSIYFKERDNTRVAAATLQSGYTVSINPKKIAQSADSAAVFADMYKKLNAVTPIDEDEFNTKTARKDDPYEEIAHRIPKSTADAVIALKLPGVSVSRESWRFYPGGSTAAHVLGFLAYQGDTVAGRYGIERYYNDVLSRESENLYANFFAELFSNIASSITEGENAREGDIVLTIEPNVQKQLELELRALEDEWHAESIGGIIMDPRTGRIYSLASIPNFDPNTFQGEEHVSVFSNQIVEGVYEMGSIIKPLVMAAALDMNAVRPETTYNDTGTVVVDGKKISNYDGKARGVVSMQEVLSQSLNVGMVHVMEEMGRVKFTEYMKSYGLGEETGIELPNETHGLISNLDSPRDVEHATASFGQGIALTPIETVRALASLGNGGFLVDPYIVDSIEYTWGGEKVTEPATPTRVLKSSTSEDITRMLVTVVDKALLGGTMKMEHYQIAAKTGTAQIADSVNGGYYTDQYLHSFFGYFPAYDPKFIIFLYHVNPKGAQYASATLTKPFFNLTKFLINYYEIPPDR